MTTRQLLVQYQEFTREGKNKEAEAFLDANKDNKRFVSLVNLRIEFLTKLRNELAVRLTS